MSARAPVSAVIVIPARMASTRLPGKPLADILGAPMIVRVWERAMESDLGPVVVAAGEAEIVEAVRAAGGTAVLTRPDHPSGSDRIHEAVDLVDPDRKHDAVVNVQGDLPTIDPKIIRAAFVTLTSDPEIDISTLVVEIEREEDRTDPNVVKAIIEPRGDGRIGRALYFTRVTAPSGVGPHYHHIGLYGYRRDALDRFVATKPGVLERRERLEQLRALGIGMRVDAAIVDDIPLGVDTPAELERARAMLAARVG